MTTPNHDEEALVALVASAIQAGRYSGHMFPATHSLDFADARRIVAAIRDSGLTVIATGGADETEPEHLFFAADVIERLHHDVEDADSQTVSAWWLRDRAHTIGCERRAAQVAERNNP